MGEGMGVEGVTCELAHTKIRISLLIPVHTMSQ